MTNDRIEELLAKFLAGDISADEKAELEQWLSTDERHNIFQFVHKEEWVKRGIAELDQIDVDSGYEKFVNKYQAPEPVMQESYNLLFAEPKRKPWYMIAAAAAAMIIISLGSWYYFFRTPPKQQAQAEPENRYRNEVAPGGNVATLQLADGRTIRLDQSGNGLLADEGEATVQKTADDKLEYNTNPAGNKGATLFNTISTPSGGQYRVVLPDGSKVWLNAASTIRFPLSFTGSERRVVITGEAFFDVVQLKRGQQKIPFMVSILQPSGASSGEVQVLGTRFNINAYNDEMSIKTTLMKGSVRFVPSDKPELAKLIVPGQQAEYHQNGSLEIRTPDTSSIVGWREGRFNFQNESIQSIMRQLARWYNVKVVFQDNIEARFVATFPRDIQLGEMLKILEKTNIIRFSIDGKTVTVMR